MLRQALTDEGDRRGSLEPVEFRCRGLVLDAMMKLETANRHDWKGFSRILEIMSFIDEIENFSVDEVREILERLCQLPPCPGETMSMEEVVFWAGVAAGMEIAEHTEEGRIDPETAERIMVFSSVFEHSTKTAIVDLALGDIEQPPVYQKTR